MLFILGYQFANHNQILEILNKVKEYDIKIFLFNYFQINLVLKNI
jgi:hypothetical protein